MSTPARRARAEALARELQSRFPGAQFEQVATPEEGGVIATGLVGTEREQMQGVVDSWDWRERRPRNRSDIEADVLAWLREPTLNVAAQLRRLQVVAARLAGEMIRRSPELGGGQLPEGEEL